MCGGIPGWYLVYIQLYAFGRGLQCAYIWSVYLFEPIRPPLFQISINYSNNAHTRTCRGSSVLLLLSVRNIFSSIQDLGPMEPAERGNLGGAMTLLEKGFFMGEIWLTVPGTPMPPPRRWSLPHDIPPEFQPLPWWLPHGDGFIMGWRCKTKGVVRPETSLRKLARRCGPIHNATQVCDTQYLVPIQQHHNFLTQLCET